MSTNYTVSQSNQVFSVSAAEANEGDYCLQYMPKCEYMGGCAATSIGMLLGYYDYNGYTVEDREYDFSFLIDDNIELDSRNNEGNVSIYDMTNDSVLAQFIASEGYYERFATGERDDATDDEIEYTQRNELQYTFIGGDPQKGLNTGVWDCLSDYLGTGQYWRGNTDTGTRYFLNKTLKQLKTEDITYNIFTDDEGKAPFEIPWEYIDFKYGLSLYVESRNLTLDEEKTATYSSNYSFDMVVNEINAGRPVLLSMATEAGAGHMVVVYGYNQETNELIFDDTYKIGRMKWDGTYDYFGTQENQEDDFLITGIHTVVFDVSNYTAKPNITLSTTEPTNQDITVTITFDDRADVKQYKIGDDEWKDYNGEFTISANTTIYARARDNADEENFYAEAKLRVTNIDKIAPAEPTNIHASVPNNKPAKQVTVTAEFSKDSVTKEYKIGENGEWTEYQDNGVVVENNTIVSFRGIDEAGNVSDVVSYEVTNIDRIPPKAPSIHEVDETLTNKDVIVTAEFSEDSVTKQYKIGENGEWQTYTDAGVVVKDNNTTVYFRGIDEAGNESEVVSYEVTNIDKTPPEKPTVSANTEDLTNGDVTVTATFDENSAKNEYSLDNKTWMTCEGTTFKQLFEKNGTIYFRSSDEIGNTSYAEYEVTKIDKVAPDEPTVKTNITTPTNQDITVTAGFSKDSVTKEYRIGKNGEWKPYTKDGVIVKDNNTTVYFRGIDEAGNVSEEVSYTVTNIDKIQPAKPTATANITDPTNQAVTVTVKYSEDSVFRQYKIGDDEKSDWMFYNKAFTVTEATTVFLLGQDIAGNVSYGEIEISNIDKEAPDVPGGFNAENSFYTATLTWNECEDNGAGGLKGYYFRYGTKKSLKGEGEFIEENQYTLTGLVAGNYYYQVKAVDKLGNESEWSEVQSVAAKAETTISIPDNNEQYKYIKWAVTTESEDAKYIVEYSKNGFANIITLTTTSTGVDFYGMLPGVYQWRVSYPFGQFVEGEEIIFNSPKNSQASQLHKSDADGNMDMFFAQASGVWDNQYEAQHNGILNGWKGTQERVKLNGKNRLSDVFAGSEDANVLILTDNPNGDAIFVEDIYTQFGKDAARVNQIDEIRAGNGDDIIDMTSQKFAYAGDAMKIYGGLGDDVIWANNSKNTLFGDAGNDRIVGGGNNDVIVGGIGNDSMHGGGGDDIFTFGENWGKDTIEQLAGGNVTLWFEEGSEDNWDASTMTYTDGANSVRISGITADQVTLKFGDTDTAVAGAFLDAASEKIFEDKNKGMIA